VSKKNKKKKKKKKKKKMAGHAIIPLSPVAVEHHHGSLYRCSGMEAFSENTGG